MNTISAIILAAGKSTRMGQQKMLMPWGETTVLGTVIQTLRAAEIEDITLVTNTEIAARMSNTDVRISENNNGEMLVSLQVGLQAQNTTAEATLICLGDQPQIEEGSVRSVCEAFRKSRSTLVVPSYQMRRGHPWLAARSVWGEILTTQGNSMREFLSGHANQIEYVNLDTATILQDLDTPDDYLKYKPRM
jgi:molybdenum cofactor cytidylyltransferase